jgi:hypothetical protein
MDVYWVQYTSWAFGQRLRAAGLLASMGAVGDCYDNAMMESFWGTMQLELLDSKPWQTRDDLANAVFEWIECWYNPNRRHSSIGMHSPVTFETLHTRSSLVDRGPPQATCPVPGPSSTRSRLAWPVSGPGLLLSVYLAAGFVYGHRVVVQIGRVEDASTRHLVDAQPG